MFPLTSWNSISLNFFGRAFGKKLDKFSFLLGEEVRILILSTFKEVFFMYKISRKSALLRVAKTSVPSEDSIGRSFQECTARSAFPDNNSSLMSDVKTPISGILSKEVSVSKSP